MNDEKTEDKLHGSTQGGSPWVLLDKRYSVSGNPKAFDTIAKQNEVCIEVYHGLNMLKEGFLGGFFSVVSFIFVLWIVFPTWEIFAGLVGFIILTILPFIIFGRRLYSNIRLNHKTQKLYAVDKNTDKLIEMDWADIEIRQFTNVRTSGRGLSADFNLDFHGKDKNSGSDISMTTPMINGEENSLSNWEYIRQFMDGVPLGKLIEKEEVKDKNTDIDNEEGVVNIFPSKDYPVGQTTKERIAIYIDKWFYGKGITPLKELFKGFVLALKDFKVHYALLSILLMIIPIGSLLMALFGLPGVIFESWVYFNVKHHPKFPKEIDELCRFSEK